MLLGRDAAGTGKQGKVVIQHDRRRVQECYAFDRKRLGAGSYGTVCRATHYSTKAVYAVKTVSKTHIKSMERLRREIDMMRAMDHPNVVKLYETFEDKRAIHLVLELCAGGHLLDSIIELGCFAESQAAMCMQQIVRAVYYMHEKCVCHRDLKPDNLMFASAAPIEQNVLKVIDFGVSSHFQQGKMLHTKCGSPFYSSPQVLAGTYDQSADLWSVGVIMYVLLCGYPPFYGETQKEAMASVRRGAFSFPAKHWSNVSEDAKHLIRQLLKMKPDIRYTAEQALNHAWIKHTGVKHQVSLQPDFVSHLRAFRSEHKLKQVALQIIAGQLDEGQLQTLRESFMALDGNGNGCLSPNEMRQGLNRAGFKDLPDDLQQILQDLDSDNSGSIDYSEFLAAALQQKQYIKENVLWMAFSVFDRDGDGVVTHEELKQVLTCGNFEEALDESEVAMLLQEVDKNGDGTIDFEEFMALMNNGPLAPASKFNV